MKLRIHRLRLVARQLVRKQRIRRWLNAVHRCLDTPKVKWFSLSVTDDDGTVIRDSVGEGPRDPAPSRPRARLGPPSALIPSGTLPRQPAVR